MAGTGRASHRDLIAELRQEGFRFRFPQAVHLLARAQGVQGVPANVRFRTPASLAFPASEIIEVESTPEQDSLHLTVGFMGLTGPSGTLPTSYTELLIERRQQHRDEAAHAFLDVFSHRAITLFYHAWQKYRFHATYEAGGQGGFTRNLMDLVGVGLSALQQRLHAGSAGVPPNLFAFYAGLLAQRPVSAENLAALIRGYFGVAVRIEQFVGTWQHLGAVEQSRLGRANCQLGQDAVCGERVWDRQNTLRMHLGPLDGARFADLTPGSRGAVALRELVHFCVGAVLACEVVLILRRDAIPAPVLDASAAPGCRLGYNCWLHTRPAERDAADMRFALQS